MSFEHFCEEIYPSILHNTICINFVERRIASMTRMEIEKMAQVANKNPSLNLK